MGTHCSSELRRGHKGIIIMKLFVDRFGCCGFCRTRMVLPRSLQLSYSPMARSEWTGFSSTLWGAPGYRGKRSAEPEPYYGYPYLGYYGLPYGRGVAGHAGGGLSYTQRSPQGIGKRSADEAEEPSQALAT